MCGRCSPCRVSAGDECLLPGCSGCASRLHIVDWGEQYMAASYYTGKYNWYICVRCTGSCWSTSPSCLFWHQILEPVQNVESQSFEFASLAQLIACSLIHVWASIRTSTADRHVVHLLSSSPLRTAPQSCMATQVGGKYSHPAGQMHRPHVPKHGEGNYAAFVVIYNYPDL